MTVPQVYWSVPGVLRHDYPQSEAPVIPQIEDWKWMWISEDNNWAIVIWCGSNPMLDYNGAFVLSRHRSDGTLEPDMEPTIRYIDDTVMVSWCHPVISVDSLDDGEWHYTTL